MFSLLLARLGIRGREGLSLNMKFRVMLWESLLASAFEMAIGEDNGVLLAELSLLTGLSGSVSCEGTPIS